jgi:hypothetical protein
VFFSVLLRLLFIVFSEGDDNEMEVVNTILMALTKALTSSGQAVLNDAAKEALTCLKQHLVKAFSGQQKSLMILDEFQRDPDI